MKLNTPFLKIALLLRIKSQLSGGGILKLQGEEVQTTTKLSDAGTLWVELFDGKPKQKLQLTIKLLDWE